jgi:hypothetical protein
MPLLDTINYPIHMKHLTSKVKNLHWHSNASAGARSGQDLPLIHRLYTKKLTAISSVVVFVLA